MACGKLRGREVTLKRPDRRDRQDTPMVCVLSVPPVPCPRDGHRRDKRDILSPTLSHLPLPRHARRAYVFRLVERKDVDYHLAYATHSGNRRGLTTRETPVVRPLPAGSNLLVAPAL
jgi:hypothetical protein